MQLLEPSRLGCIFDQALWSALHAVHDHTQRLQGVIRHSRYHQRIFEWYHRGRLDILALRDLLQPSPSTVATLGPDRKYTARPVPAPFGYHTVIHSLVGTNLDNTIRIIVSKPHYECARFALLRL